jgi:hypothetical protein
VNARGLRGDVKLDYQWSVTGGHHSLRRSASDFSRLVNGSVTLVIPSDSNASVRAGTVHGSITNDFGLRVKHGNTLVTVLTGK